MAVYSLGAVCRDIVVTSYDGVLDVDGDKNGLIAEEVTSCDVQLIDTSGSVAVRLIKWS